MLLAAALSHSLAGSAPSGAVNCEKSGHWWFRWLEPFNLCVCCGDLTCLRSPKKKSLTVAVTILTATVRIHSFGSHLQTCAHPTWFLLTIILSATVQKSPGAYVSKCGPTSISSDCSLCQMSQNNCYDSQGHWENSSAVGMSVQMSPAVTPGASGPFWKNSPAPLNSDWFIDH